MVLEAKIFLLNLLYPHNTLCIRCGIYKKIKLPCQVACIPVPESTAVAEKTRREIESFICISLSAWHGAFHSECTINVHEKKFFFHLTPIK